MGWIDRSADFRPLIVHLIPVTKFGLGSGVEADFNSCLLKAIGALGMLISVEVDLENDVVSLIGQPS